MMEAMACRFAGAFQKPPAPHMQAEGLDHLAGGPGRTASSALGGHLQGIPKCWAPGWRLRLGGAPSDDIQEGSDLSPARYPRLFFGLTVKRGQHESPPHPTIGDVVLNGARQRAQPAQGGTIVGRMVEGGAPRLNIQPARAMGAPGSRQPRYAPLLGFDRADRCRAGKS